MAVPVKAKISTVYNRPGSHWKLGRHTGVDFSVPTGTKVVSAMEGTVLEAGVNVSWGPSYGISVIIDHGQGIRAIYAHLSALKVKKGDKVEEGELIGLSGNSGNSTGPHLHFESRVSPWRYGNDIDPTDLFDAKISIRGKVTAKLPKRAKK
jgi:murein DD-endopeptidase MepM/ murein hydrolase activator NlpD